MDSVLTAKGLLAVYLLAVNLAAFVLYGADKRRAKQGAWRVPEKTLFLLPLLGGSVGGHPRDAGVSPQDEALVLPHRPAPDPAGPDRAGGLAEDKVIKKEQWKEPCVSTALSFT